VNPELTWFFGYGSLMWRPGFAFEAFEPARLDGWHRALCILSTHYRGTPERPGLVLGLDRGGSCVGRAAGVAEARAAEVLRYLDERELLTNYVYERRQLPVTILRDGSKVEAWCYLAKPEHEAYRGGLEPSEVLAHVRDSHGLTGSNADYIRHTMAHLAELGIREPALELLAAELDAPSATATERRAPLAGA
jgi:glutathione-specific gamma-glutamylcyclotransferase